MNIKDIRRLLNKNVLWTTHCLQRMGERDIKRSDVKNCIVNGEIIEEYPDDLPYPSCLVFGMTLENKALHVVVGFDADALYIITAYYPTEDKFGADLKTRRK